MKGVVVRVAVVAIGILIPLILRTGVARADDDAGGMTARVDALLAERWGRAGLSPARDASDAEFLRRVYLDLTGIIPPVNEARSFLTDTSSDKRQRLIDALLARPVHARHLSNVWRDIMLPRDNNIQRLAQVGPFQVWLRDQFLNNIPYDKVVRDILTARGQVNEIGPVLFYAALELKPEELAASTSRVFLGVQIQCAQCHNHPFDHWTQSDFWGYAAFFAQLVQPPQQPQRVVSQVMDSTSGDVKLPKSDAVVAPKFLGTDEATPGEGIRREQLARWLTARENPYFAKATVNRVWALLFGKGLVDPVDDFGGHNLPSHPELLNELAADFIAHGHDIRRLFRVLANTKAYQLSSEYPENGELLSDLFARMAIKSLNAEQIYDCLAEATRKREFSQAATGIGVGALDQNRLAFTSKFEAPTQKTTEFQSGIPQALTMMNGRLVAEVTTVQTSDLLAALVSAPFMTDKQRVETIFLAALSRLPTDAELDRIRSYADQISTNQDPAKQLLGDLLWTLVNSAEFMLNH